MRYSILGDFSEGNGHSDPIVEIDPLGRVRAIERLDRLGESLGLDIRAVRSEDTEDSIACIGDPYAIRYGVS